MEGKLYCIPIDYDSKQWSVTKTSEELHKIFKVILKREKAIKKNSCKNAAKITPETKIFNIKDQLIILKTKTYEEEALAYFFKELLSNQDYSSNTLIQEFIEYSVHSRLQPTKRKEGFVFKRTGGRHGNEGKCMYFCKYCRRLQKRWLILTEDFVGYTTNSRSEHLHEVLMFKDNFQIKHTEAETEYPDGIIITTLRRVFFFHAGSIQKKNEWVDAIVEAQKNSKWNSQERLYDSSFPLRAGNNAKYYVDGEEYFRDVYENLMNAKDEVFITDWWLSPELYLLRPSTENSESQIIKVLKTLAERGVKIFIHMYKEVTFACTFDSLHSKEILKKNIKKNIQIIRHPQRSLMGILLSWSHHEKIVCIDQTIAFLGGLDLCFGRWDNSSHRLTDIKEPYVWNGIDYANNRIKDFINVRDYEKTQINRYTEPRMPWHDIALRVEGSVASDIAIHFIELWNHVMTDITGHYHRNKKLLRESASFLKGDLNRLSNEREDNIQGISTISEARFEEEEEKISNIKEKISNIEEKSLSIKEQSSNIEEKKDSSTVKFNFFKKEKPLQISSSCTDQKSKDFISDLQRKMQEGSEKQELLNSKEENLEKPAENKKPNLLAKMLARKSQANPLSKFLDNVKTVSEEEMKEKIKNEEIRDKLDLEEEKLMIENMKKNDGEGYLPYMLLPVTSNLLKYHKEDISCECEVVRSACEWSYGLNKSEASINKAYLDLIVGSKHFIYIENQFFISSTAGPPVLNGIAQALVERITRAFCSQEKFRVIVVMPLLPGFEGNVYDPTATVLKIQLDWEYKTICRSDNSLIHQFRKKGITPNEYISFYGLRNHAIIKPLGDDINFEGIPVTEIVYVHSKTMIVDDDIAIIGSANINDRSMIGNHDSEIAIVIKDEHKIESRMNGENYSCGKFAATLRRKLFREFLGDLDVDLIDPLDEFFIQSWVETARKNTEAYREVFACYPDDEYATMEQIIKKTAQRPPPEELLRNYKEVFSNVHGLLVEFPLNFLVLEDLSPHFLDKENFLKTESFI